MINSAAPRIRWLRFGGQVVVAVVVAWLTVLNVSVLIITAIDDIGSPSGFTAWSVLLTTFALAPVLVGYLRWRRGRQAGLETTAAVWTCVLSVLVAGIVSLPVTVMVIAV